jgi:predicted DNA-binding transcriptional regulator AlpA
VTAKQSPGAENAARGARVISARAESDLHTTTVGGVPPCDLAVYDGRRLAGFVRPIGSIYAAYTETAVGISLSFFYELKQAGLAPRAMKLGTRRIISVEEAQKWCRERTEASGKVVREARQP